MSGLVKGLQRRLFRAALQRETRMGRCGRGPGAESLCGYDVTMHFPDRLIWANQILEIIGTDCYGIHKLPAICNVVDGGANIGTFVLFLKWVRPLAHVIAVEPSPKNLVYLRRNAAGYPESDVEIVPVALGEREGMARLSGPTSDGLRIGSREGSEVEVKPLSELIKGSVDLLKLDIEGGELGALKGAGDALSQVARVVCEYHQYPARRGNLGEVISLLESYGFEHFRTSREIVFGTSDARLPEYCCLIEATRSED